jgi:serine/threonine-protein kinase mTOR
MDFEVKRALEFLSSDRHESRRHAAVLVLRELARNSPTLFYAYVPQVLDLLWVALRDPKVVIRDSAAECLSCCLEIISQRETALRVQWYTKILEEAQFGLRSSNADYIHGSLLAYRELLLRAGMFMHERYNEVCDVVLRHRDHKDGLIRRTVVSLIPILAGYNPEEFVATYLHRCMMHLLGQMKKDRDRAVAFTAIGQVAIAVGASILPYLDHIVASLKEALTVAARGYVPFPDTLTISRGKGTISEAPMFQCISMVATAVGQNLMRFMPDLLDLMFTCGLSEALRQALVDLAHNIPQLLPTIQQRLLNLLSVILSGQKFRPQGSPERINNVPTIPNQQPADKDSELITLALNTLGGFDFSGILSCAIYLTLRNCSE